MCLCLDLKASLPVPTTNVQTASTVTPATTSIADADTTEKKIKALKKKLRAIEELEGKLKGGEVLTEEQQAKLNSKSSIEKELSLLSI